METLEAKNLLKMLGVSSQIVAGVLIVGGIFFVYKTYLETTQIKLQIEQLRRDLSAPKT